MEKEDTSKQEQLQEIRKEDIETQISLPQQFIKTEKNLETLGFFSPSSKRSRRSKKKLISFTKIIDSNTVEAETIIFPSAEFGLPNTSDLDKYRAFQKILSDEIAKNGKVPKHITITSADLIKTMKRSKEGKLYKEIEDWLMRMALTGIQSGGTVWLANKKMWAKDLFHIFDRVIIYGQQLDDGTVADCHHIWLSDWQVENINAFYLLTLDYELYKQLRKPIAKSLLSMLQIGFYASGRTFTKRYDELCKFFGITKYRSLSKIKEQLDPSNEELKSWGFILEYDYAKNADGNTYNIIWKAGERFYNTQNIKEMKKAKALGTSQQLEFSITKKKKKQKPLLLDESEQKLVRELEDRGLATNVSRAFISQYDKEYIREKIEMFDNLISQDKSNRNPAGWLRCAIEKDYQPSKEYLDSQNEKLRRKILEERQERWLKHRAELISQDIANWNTISPAERIAGRLEFWLAGEKINSRWPTEEQIESMRQEMIDSLPKTDEEKWEYLSRNYSEEPPDDFE